MKMYKNLRRRALSYQKGIPKKNRQRNGQKQKDKGQTTIYKTLHRKLKTVQHKLHVKIR